MSAKENFSKAMFDMFGVGSASDDTENKAEAAVTAAAEPAAPADKEPVEEMKAYVYAKKTASTVSAAPAAPAAGQTCLAADTTLEGTLRTKGDVTIAGTFKGDIVAEGDVTLYTSVTGNVTARNLTLMGCDLRGECTTTETVVIREKASLQGNIKAKEVLCSGAVDGDIVASDNVKLETTARVKGNITAGSLSVERGAFIQGQLAIS